MVRRGQRLLEEHLLHRRGQHLARHRPLIDHCLAARPRHLGQAAQRLVLEQVARRQRQARLAGPAHHLDRHDRIAAKLEIVVIQAYLGNPSTACQICARVFCVAVCGAL